MRASILLLLQMEARLNMRSMTAFFRMLGCALALLAIWNWPSAEAIPAFARKYQTSCQTCHIAFPKLNPFGMAFRLRGYHLPDETEDLIKEKPISLGAPAYKKLWPQTVWPSDMPGTVPLSLGTIFTDATERTTEEGESKTIKNDLRFPEEVAILSGGTLGESISFFGEIVFASEIGEIGVELEHAQVNFNGPFGSGHAFNVKVGRFMPEMTQSFSHGSVLTTEGPAALFGFVPISAHGGSEVGGEEGAGIALPHTVDGLEAYGILGHRILYSVGFSNGLGPGPDSMDGNSAKDVFGRAAFKIGGLPWDGEGYVASDKNWSELSMQVGVFGYRGNGKNIFFSGGDEGNLLEDRIFTRLGVDANLYIESLNLIAGYAHGEDEIANYVGTVSDVGKFRYNTWFIEGDYVLLPWLQPAVRYEWLDPGNKEAPKFERIVPNVTALIRANVKAYLEYQRNVGENDDYALLAGLRVLF
jgi:hypothetical protein